MNAMPNKAVTEKVISPFPAIRILFMFFTWEDIWKKPRVVASSWFVNAARTDCPNLSGTPTVVSGLRLLSTLRKSQRKLCGCCCYEWRNEAFRNSGTFGTKARGALPQSIYASSIGTRSHRNDNSWQTDPSFSEIPVDKERLAADVRKVVIVVDCSVKKNCVVHGQ